MYLTYRQGQRWEQAGSGRQELSTQGPCCRPCLLLSGSSAGPAVHSSVQISMDGTSGVKGMPNNISTPRFVVHHPPLPGQAVFQHLQWTCSPMSPPRCPEEKKTFLHVSCYSFSSPAFSIRHLLVGPSPQEPPKGNAWPCISQTLF